MRDFETIETALLAAETGHLVFSTLHTLDATETINRIIAVFPPHQQKQIRLQLASVLKAVISQRLMPRADGKGRVPAVEVLISTAFIRDCIVDKEKTHLIHGAIAQGTSQYGMQTFDQSIFSLFEQGLVTYEEALRWAINVDEFKLKVQGISHDRRHGARPDGADVGADHRRQVAGDHAVRRLDCDSRRRDLISAYLDGADDARAARAVRGAGPPAPRPPRATTPTTIDDAVARLAPSAALDDARVAGAIARTRDRASKRGRLRVRRADRSGRHRRGASPSAPSTRCSPTLDARRAARRRRSTRRLRGARRASTDDREFRRGCIAICVAPGLRAAIASSRLAATPARRTRRDPDAVA